ncbi:hypothetical protein E8E11_006763 [Didymella keratinophila]|nr:hypothetical protein E8E11_006763 [Didymella keratinophila]
MFTDVSWQLEGAVMPQSSTSGRDTPGLDELQHLVSSPDGYAKKAETKSESDEGSDDKSVLNRLSANGGIRRRVQQFPDLRHVDHVEVLTYGDKRVLDPLPVSQFLDIFRYYNTESQNHKYCVLDYDFGRKPCRDNAYKNMLCVTKDSHFKHSNGSWTPEKSDAPANLTEILESIDQKSRWKTFYRNINTTGACLWGDRCNFSHALGASKVTTASSPPTPRPTGQQPAGLGDVPQLTSSKRPRDDSDDTEEPTQPTSSTIKRRKEQSSYTTPAAFLAPAPTASVPTAPYIQPPQPPASSRPPVPRHHDPEVGMMIRGFASSGNASDPHPMDAEFHMQGAAGSDQMGIDFEFKIKGRVGENQMDVVPYHDD